jgi:hypothetical protein
MVGLPLQILWFLTEDTHLETKSGNEGKSESKQAMQGFVSRASEDSDFPST